MRRADGPRSQLALPYPKVIPDDNRTSRMATSLKIDDALKARVHRLAGLRRQSPNIGGRRSTASKNQHRFSQKAGLATDFTKQISFLPIAVYITKP
jgi:hypothetical protein